MSDSEQPPPSGAPEPRLATTNITEILQTAYIDYSMSVIISRALPDARDGLKPVQRRILYAMLREGLLHNRAFDKCAGVVGEVLKNYHPHGDASVYDTLVRLAQPWVMRYPLIDPQGNFGSVDGDPPAAYRYTESRLNEVAEELLKDIDEETVDFAPNYKETTTEPTVLPAALPNLLMNGSTGIAVGMATNIPPHNLDELVRAIVLVIDKPETTIDELCQIVLGPDFPTGGIIAGRAGIDSYLRTGRGHVRMRGTWNTEQLKGDREAVVFTELPYSVNRKTLVEHIAELIREKKIEGVSDLRDESDENTRIVVELKRGEQAEKIANQLYEQTALQSTFGVIMLALDKRRPRQMNLRELIDCYVDHRRDVLTRRTQYRLRKAEERAHILEGIKIALDNLDDFVRIIRASNSRDEARTRLLEKYPISQIQADHILDMRLYQLTGLEREKIEAEYLAIMAVIEELRGILEDDGKLRDLVKAELLEVAPRYSSPRRTQIIADPGEFRPEDLIPNEGCIITVSHLGFVKRTPEAEYRSQRRGGKGILSAETYNDDFIEHLFTTKAHDTILFITTKGQAFGRKAYAIPEGARTSKGKSIASILNLRPEEKVAAMICFPEFREDRYLVLATKAGVVKKTNLGEYASSIRENGIIGINLEENDSLVGAVLTSGDDEIMLVSHQGLAVRFKERNEDGSENLRSLSRATGGVTGMKFKLEGDYLQSIEVVDHSAQFLVASEAGYGCRTDFADYRLVSRGSLGVKALDLPDDGSVNLAGALSVHETDEIMLLTAKGQSIRCPVRDIRQVNRGAKGVRLVDLSEGDKLVSIARVVVETDPDADATTEADSPAPAPESTGDTTSG
jgi:DNA gyrase subunit A